METMESFISILLHFLVRLLGMSFFLRLGTNHQGWCSRYSHFVNNLDGVSLNAIAIATVALGVVFFNQSKRASKDVLQLVNALTVVYVICLTGCIHLLRAAILPPPPPPQGLPHLRRFCRSVYYSFALYFFFKTEDAIKSVPNSYIPWICLLAYMHILILLLILRLRNDYGFSDGFLAASFSLLYPMCDSNLKIFFFVLGTTILMGLKNLQLNPPPPPVQNPPLPPPSPPPPFHIGTQIDIIVRGNTPPMAPPLPNLSPLRSSRIVRQQPLRFHH